jgi:glycosyltransferase involved in cell wall biosynthesis
MSAAPVISVILASKNPGPRLQVALKSVWEQQNASCEIIVIDGASTDGTREWLEPLRDRFGALVSEPDAGVYAAMNKGLRFVRGNWVLFLGADDRLADPEVLARASAYLGTHPAAVLVGEAAFDDGRIYPLANRPWHAARNFVHHQAAFYHRDCFAGGGYDESLRFQADYDLNLRLWRAGIPIASLSLRVAVCGSGGLSDAGRWANYREEIVVRHRHFPAWQCVLWDAGSVVRYFRKRIVRSRASTRPE